MSHLRKHGEVTAPARLPPLIAMQQRRPYGDGARLEPQQPPPPPQPPKAATTAAEVRQVPPALRKWLRTHMLGDGAGVAQRSSHSKAEPGPTRTTRGKRDRRPHGCGSSATTRLRQVAWFRMGWCRRRCWPSSRALEYAEARRQQQLQGWWPSCARRCIGRSSRGHGRWRCNWSSWDFTSPSSWVERARRRRPALRAGRKLGVSSTLSRAEHEETS